MTALDKNTETQILEAAKKVFVKKGFDGARMQEIADEAGINKALLHYYFRSKDKLFTTIFIEVFQHFVPKLAETMGSSKPFFDKIKLFIESYIDMLSANPHLPIFILNEMHRNPQRIIELFGKSGVKPEFLFGIIEAEIKKGTIIRIRPQHFIINILAMCVFPFAGRPIIQGFIFKNNKKEYEAFLLERKKEVCAFVINSIKK
jgi:TetR/AcrR family transcriptional regulator